MISRAQNLYTHRHSTLQTLATLKLLPTLPLITQTLRHHSDSIEAPGGVDADEDHPSECSAAATAGFGMRFGRSEVGVVGRGGEAYA